eukprot:Nk52_evm75s223 gene=Nk52_evmTU75s223
MSFLFGNINAEGNLEDEDNILDADELKQLNAVAATLGSEAEAVLGPESKASLDRKGGISREESLSEVKPLANAENYEDASELAEEEGERESRQGRSAPPSVVLYGARRRDSSSDDEDYDDDNEMGSRKIPTGSLDHKVEGPLKSKSNNLLSVAATPGRPTSSKSDELDPNKISLNNKSSKMIIGNGQFKYIKTCDVKVLFPNFKEGEVLKFSQMFAPKKTDFGGLIQQVRKKKRISERKEKSGTPAVVPLANDEYSMFLSDDTPVVDTNLNDSKISGVKEKQGASKKHGVTNGATNGLNILSFSKSVGGTALDEEARAYIVTDNEFETNTLGEANVPIKKDSTSDSIFADEVVSSIDVGFKRKWASSAPVFHMPDESRLYMISLLNWEDDIIWDSPTTIKRQKTYLTADNSKLEKYASIMQKGREEAEEELSNKLKEAKEGKEGKEKEKSGKGKGSEAGKSTNNGFESLFLPKNEDLDAGTWEDAIVWDDTNISSAFPFTKLIYNQNDGNILFEYPGADKVGVKAEKGAKSKKAGLANAKKIAEAAAAAEEDENGEPKDELANDQWMSKAIPNAENSQVHGQTRLQVVHAVPALRLFDLYFPPHIDRAFLRNWHRPPLSIFAEANKFYTLSCLTKSIRKKAKEREKERIASGAELVSMKKTKDLTGKDGDIVFFEYSEQYPPLLSNVGMCSVMYSYFRPKSEASTYIPKSAYGQISLVSSKTQFPFIGELVPGAFMRSVENGLFTAPAFCHAFPKTDFLVIRNGNKFSIRGVRNTFVVGQTIPRHEVFPPGSRKNSSLVKDRIQVYIYRLFKTKNALGKDGLRRLTYGQVKEAFPAYDDMILRKRLKTIAVGGRGTSLDSVWVLKSGPDAPPVPSEEMLRGMLTPEQVCAHESMLATLQRLKERGYSTTPADLIDEDVDPKEKNATENEMPKVMETDVKISSWNVTKNLADFMMSKCQIVVRGPGDPTGVGEGFSFVRQPVISIKESEVKGNQMPPLDLSQMPKVLLKHILKNLFHFQEEELIPLSSSDLRELTARHLINISKDSDPLSKFSKRVRGGASDYDEKYVQSCQQQFLIQKEVLSCKENVVSAEEEELKDFSKSLEEDLLGLTPNEEEKETTGTTKEKEGKGKSKFLLIHRTYAHKDGRLYKKTEVVKDPRVIALYLQKIKTREEAAKVAAENRAKAEAERKALQRTEVIFNPNSNVAVDLAKSKTFASEEGSFKKKKIKPLKVERGPGRVYSLVRCGACGRPGHNRMNMKMCPVMNGNWDDGFNEEEFLAKEAQAQEGGPSSEAAPAQSESSIPKLTFKAVASAQTKKPAAVKIKLSNPSKWKSEGTKSELSESSSRRVTPLTKLNRMFERCCEKMIAVPNSDAFHMPVTSKIAPNYDKFVKEPMDLTTLRQNTKQEQYQSRADFLADVDKILNNSTIYNGPESPYTILARDVRNAGYKYCRKHEGTLTELEGKIF